MNEAATGESGRGSFNPLVPVVGPTAVGKTALALCLAEALKGEIVSADSRLLYRGMDIGTDKPSEEQLATVRHHLVDIVEPDETVSLAEYKDRAICAIEGIQARGMLPILVGGTGQYQRAIVEGWHIPRVPPNPSLRAELESIAESEGAIALHAQLANRDPVAASRIDARNVRRVVRALEVCIITNKPISEQQGRTPPRYHVLILGLTMERQLLYERADKRVDAMIESGLEDEVRGLLAVGYDWRLPSMSALGYAQFRAHFQGSSTRAEVVRDIKRATHAFIRRQYNWFRLTDERIHWFDRQRVTDSDIVDAVREWLESGGKHFRLPSNDSDGRMRRD